MAARWLLPLSLLVLLMGELVAPRLASAEQATPEAIPHCPGRHPPTHVKWRRGRGQRWSG